MRLAPAALAVLAGLWMAPAPQPPAVPNQKLATVHVAVEREDGTPVADLQPEEFTVLLDGAPHPVVAVSPGPRPLSIALLIDVTTRPPLPRRTLRAAIEHFLEGLTEEDRARVWRVGGGVTAGPPFTADVRTLLAAARPALDARDAERSGPSPIWDAIVEAIGDLRQENRRRAIVLISDARATGNRHGLAAAVEHASVADVAVNVVAPPGAEVFWSDSRAVKVHPEWMPEALAVNTGGVLLHYRDGDELGDRLGRILAALRQSYAVTIPRPDGTAQRLVEVRVARPDLSLRSRRILQP